jgi:hypothetical protein
MGQEAPFQQQGKTSQTREIKEEERREEETVTDNTLIAEASMGILDSIEEKFGETENAEILAVGIVVAVSTGDMTFTRTYCTDKIHYRALGLFNAAVETIEDGASADE